MTGAGPGREDAMIAGTGDAMIAGIGGAMRTGAGAQTCDGGPVGRRDAIMERADGRM